MAILTVVSVRDSAANLFSAPFFVPNANVARRSFQDEVNRNEKGNNYHAHADDFELYDLGFYQEETASFELHDQPKLIVRAKDLRDA